MSDRERKSKVIYQYSEVFCAFFWCYASVSQPANSSSSNSSIIITIIIIIIISLGYQCPVCTVKANDKAKGGQYNQQTRELINDKGLVLTQTEGRYVQLNFCESARQRAWYRPEEYNLRKAGFHHVGRGEPFFTITPAPPSSQWKRAPSTSSPSTRVRGENNACVCGQNRQNICRQNGNASEDRTATRL